MSQENVEIVRAAIDAFNRGDVDAALKDVSPEFEFDQTRAVGLDRGGSIVRVCLYQERQEALEAAGLSE
jgi:limonene-1,2-epoxide hydrolase